MARPTDFTPELGKEICRLLATGLSLRRICDGEDFPSRESVNNWLFKGKQDQSDKIESPFRTFLDQYAHAREAQADVLMDETIDIADDGRNDWMEYYGRDGEPLGWKINGEAVARSKLRVEARMKYASQVAPKKYGAKVDLTHKGDEQAPIAFTLKIDNK